MVASRGKGAHREGLWPPPGPPGRAGWPPSSSRGCCLGRCASAPPSCCGTRPRCTLQREGRLRPPAPSVGIAANIPESGGTLWLVTLPPRLAEMSLLAMILFAALR